MPTKHILRCLAGIPALLLFTACPDKDEAMTDSTGSTTGSTTDPTTTDGSTTVEATTEATTGATTGATTEATTEGTTGTTGTTGGPVFPLECGDLTCAEGQICVNPGDVCNYDLDPPDWVAQPSACQDVPPQCAQMQDPAAQIMCIGLVYCINSEFGVPTELQTGVLQCADQGLDCF